MPTEFLGGHPLFPRIGFTTSSGKSASQNREADPSRSEAQLLKLLRIRLPSLGHFDMQVELGFLTDDTIDRSAQLLLDPHQMFRVVADDDRLLRIALHVDRYNHLSLARIGFATVIVLRILDGIDNHCQRIIYYQKTKPMSIIF